MNEQRCLFNCRQEPSKTWMNDAERVRMPAVLVETTELMSRTQRINAGFVRPQMALRADNCVEDFIGRYFVLAPGSTYNAPNNANMPLGFSKPGAGSFVTAAALRSGH